MGGASAAKRRSDPNPEFLSDRQAGAEDHLCTEVSQGASQALPPPRGSLEVTERQKAKRTHEVTERSSA